MGSLVICLLICQLMLRSCYTQEKLGAGLGRAEREVDGAVTTEKKTEASSDKLSDYPPSKHLMDLI